MPEASNNFCATMQSASQRSLFVFVLEGGDVDGSDRNDTSRTAPRAKGRTERATIQFALNFVAAYLLHAPPL